MVNYQHQHMKKREIVEIQKIEYKYKSKKQSLNYSIKIKKSSMMLQYKNTCYSWTELNTDNSKIGSWARDWLGVQFPFFLGLSATIPSMPEGTGTPYQRAESNRHDSRDIFFSVCIWL